MPLINYEATIREAFNKHGRMLGTSIEMLVPSMKGCKAKGYFFLEKEASLDHDITLAQHSADGNIRHCTPVKDGYYDYIVRKEFKTLGDWAADCGAFISEIVYGINHYYKGDVAFMSLTRLCKRLGAIYHPEVVPKWNCPVCLVPNQMSVARCVCCEAGKPGVFGHSCQDGIRTMLEHKGLSMNELWVIHGGNATQWADFIKPE